MNFGKTELHGLSLSWQRPLQAISVRVHAAAQFLAVLAKQLLGPKQEALGVTKSVEADLLHPVV
jgi:hypothetical protein